MMGFSSNFVTRLLKAIPEFRRIAVLLVAIFSFSAIHRFPATFSAQSELTSQSDKSTDLPESVQLRIGGNSTSSANSAPQAQLQSGVRVMALSPTGKLVSTFGEPSNPLKDPYLIQLWNAESGKHVGDLEGHSVSVRAMTFRANGNMLCSVSEDDNGNGETILWDLKTKRILHRLPVAGRDVMFDFGGGQIMVTVPLQSQVLTFDVRTGEETNRSSTMRFPFKLGRRREHLISIGTSRSTQFWIYRLIDGKEVWKFDPLSNNAESPGNTTDNVRIRESFRPPSSAMQISPDGRTVAATDSRETIILWERSTGRVLHRLKAHSKKVLALTFTPDSRFLCSAGLDRTVRCWELATGQEVANRSAHQGPVTSIDTDLAGKVLASASLDRSVLLWKLSDLLHSKLPSEKPTQDRMTHLWEMLSSAEPATAYNAVGETYYHADIVLPFLKKSIHDVLVPVQSERIQQLIKELEAPSDIVRHRATEELRKLRAVAKPILIKTIRSTASAEVRYRIRRILSGSEEVTFPQEDDLRRFYRLIHALEQINTPEAKVVLNMIIDDFPDPQIVKEAENALRFMQR